MCWFYNYELIVEKKQTNESIVKTDNNSNNLN